MGVQQTHNKGVTTVWWPGFSKDVYSFVSDCDTCKRIRFRGIESAYTWPEAEPWERLHIDWAYIKGIGNVLIIVDAATTWIEAFLCTNRTSQRVAQCLMSVFARFGIPNVLVSDNGPEFIALRKWLNQCGCKKWKLPRIVQGVTERLNEL